MTEANLVMELATHDWSRGDIIQALAVVTRLSSDRYRVAGLDEDGQPSTRFERMLDAVSEPTGHGHVAVRGNRPDCAAVGLYRAAGHDHAWLVITPHRIAVLRLRDNGNAGDGVMEAAVEEAKRERSLGSALRGIGKIVRAGAAEFISSTRLAPLAERPRDAVLECPFETRRSALSSIIRWKQPMVPEFSGGPRFVQVRFTDASWARLQTDEAGLAALLGG